jgi:hypothetical protein
MTSLAGWPATAREIAGPILFLESDLPTLTIGDILNAKGGPVLCG